MPLLADSGALRAWACVALPTGVAGLCGLVAVPPGWQYRRLRSTLFLLVRRLLFKRLCWLPAPPGDERDKAPACGALARLLGGWTARALGGGWTGAGTALAASAALLAAAASDAVSAAHARAAHGPEALSRATALATARELRAQRDFWLAATVALVWAFMCVLRRRRRRRSASRRAATPSAAPTPPPRRRPPRRYVVYILQVQKRLRWTPASGWASRGPAPAAAAAVADGAPPGADGPAVPLPASPAATLRVSAQRTLDFPLSDIGLALFATGLRQRKAAAAAAAAAAARQRGLGGEGGA
jgi:hypothetical protein